MGSTLTGKTGGFEDGNGIHFFVDHHIKDVVNTKAGHDEQGNAHGIRNDTTHTTSGFELRVGGLNIFGIGIENAGVFEGNRRRLI